MNRKPAPGEWQWLPPPRVKGRAEPRPDSSGWSEVGRDRELVESGGVAARGPHCQGSPLLPALGKCSG